MNIEAKFCNLKWYRLNKFKCSIVRIANVRMGEGGIIKLTLVAIKKVVTLNYTTSGYLFNAHIII